MKIAESLLKKVIRNMVDGYAYCRIQTSVNGEPEDFMILDVNPATEKIIGIPIEKMVGKKISQVFPEIKEGDYNWIQKLGYVVLNETEQVFMHHSEKKQKWLQIRAFSPERGHLAAIITDITARQQADANLQKNNELLKSQLQEKEEEIKKLSNSLQENEIKYENLINCIPILIYKAHPESLQAIYVNRLVEDIYGYSKEEWLSNPDLWAKTIHPEDRDRVLNIFEQARLNKNNNSTQYRIIRKDNTEKTIQDTFFWEYDPNGNVVSLIGYIQEIISDKTFEHPSPVSEEKRELKPSVPENVLLLREQISEIKTREAKLKELTTYLADIFWEWDISTGKIIWLGKTKELLDLDQNELPNNIDLLKQCIHPDDYDKFFVNLNDMQKGTQNYFTSYYRIAHKDGSYKSWLSRSILYKDASGTPSKILNACTDVSEFSLLYSESKYQLLSIDEITKLISIFSKLAPEQNYIELASFFKESTNSRIAVLCYLFKNGSFTRLLTDSQFEKSTEKKDTAQIDMLNTSIQNTLNTNEEFYISNDPQKIFSDDEYTANNFIAYPIKHNNDLIALIILANKDSIYTNKDADFLKSISKIISPLINANIIYEQELNKYLNNERELMEIKEIHEKYQINLLVLQEQLENIKSQFQQLIQDSFDGLSKLINI